MKTQQTMATLLTVSTIAACAATPTDDMLTRISQAALADTSRRSGDPLQALAIASAERVVWRDGSLGCPQADRFYTQALVPGFRVIVRTRSGLLHYHAGPRGEPVLCPAERAVEPLSDDGRR